MRKTVVSCDVCRVEIQGKAPAVHLDLEVYRPERLEDDADDAREDETLRLGHADLCFECATRTLGGVLEGCTRPYRPRRRKHAAES